MTRLTSILFRLTIMLMIAVLSELSLGIVAVAYDVEVGRIVMQVMTITFALSFACFVAFVIAAFSEAA